MAKLSSRERCGRASAASGRLPQQRAGFAPLFGGALLGIVVPAFAAGAPDLPPRLRLAEEIERFPRPPVPPVGQEVLRGEQPMVLPPGEFPRLRLALELAPTKSGALANVTPSRAGNEVSSGANPFAARRQEEPVSFAALEEPRPAGPGRVDATVTTALDAPGSAISAAVIGDDEFLPADELDLTPPAGSRPLPGERPMPGNVDRKKRNWGLAPVRWGGAWTAGFRQRRTDGGSASRSDQYRLGLKGNSYLVQPYIALISGDLALGMVRSWDGGGGSAAGNNLRGTSITGNANLSLFPQSRFPFQASFGASDSRTDGSLTKTDTQSRRLSLRQDYRPAVGRWRTHGNYDRSELTGSFGRDTVDTMGAGFSTTVDRHSVSAGGSMARNRSSEAINWDYSAVLSHDVRLSDAVAIQTGMTYAGHQFERDGQQPAQRGESQSAQVYSFASWTPYESKWRGTANGRYYQTESDFNGSSFESRNAGGSASLSYQATRNLSLFGAMNADVSASGESRSHSTSQNLGINYSSDTHMFGPYGYNWYGTGGFAHSLTSTGESHRSANASAGHGLQRSWRTGERATLSGSFSQSASTSQSMGLVATSSTTLTHNVSFSLQAMATDALSGYFSTSLSDSRSKGDTNSTFQLLNTQINGQWRINTLSQLTSGFTWQVARQESEGYDSSPAPRTSRSQTSSLSGSLGYGHARAFGVRGLRYSANFRANTNITDSRQSGNPDAPRERITMDLDQRMHYRIGRLDAQLQARIAEVENQRESLIFLNVSRHFGAF